MKDRKKILDIFREDFTGDIEVWLEDISNSSYDEVVEYATRLGARDLVMNRIEDINGCEVYYGSNQRVEKVILVEDGAYSSIYSISRLDKKGYIYGTRRLGSSSIVRDRSNLTVVL